jgi:hypothetical protein
MNPVGLLKDCFLNRLRGMRALQAGSIRLPRPLGRPFG